MDPFIKEPGGNATGGQIYIDLGEVSEDILRDGRKAYENGLPHPQILQMLIQQFGDVFPDCRRLSILLIIIPIHDSIRMFGLDGLSDGDERSFFKATYLDKIQTSMVPMIPHIPMLAPTLPVTTTTSIAGAIMIMHILV